MVEEKKTILLVEDNFFNRKVSIGMLQKLKYQVEEATHGAMGLEMAQDKKYYFILMDIYMPRMDGYTVSYNIKNGDGPNKNTPIIAMTAVESRSSCCDDAGMDGFISKPVMLTRLSGEISRVLELKLR
jgi:CheY-like chemotaxis protein